MSELFCPAGPAAPRTIGQPGGRRTYGGDSEPRAEHPPRRCVERTLTTTAASTNPWTAGPPRHLAKRWTFPGGDEPDTLASRLVISTLSVAALLVGSVAWALGATHVRSAALLFFCLVGLGTAPFALHPGLRLAARAALSTIAGFAVLTFIATVMTVTHVWHPAIAFLVVAVLALALHAAGIARAVDELRRDPDHDGLAASLRSTLLGPDRPASAGNRLAAACLLIGGVLCLVASATHRHLVPGFGGFPASIGLLWYLGLALVLAAIVAVPSGDERILCIGVVLLVLILTMTPSLVYEGPRAQTAVKHVDLIQEIRTQHRLNSAVGIYNGWPGFFAAMAWLCDVTGIRNPLSLALYWPPLLATFRVASLRYLAGQVLPSARLAWTAVTLGVLADSIGADYFSPQSVGFVLGIAVFGLALSARRSALRVVLILCAGCVLAITHQLSPYVVGGVLVVLVVLRQVRPWWTPLLVLAPAGAWALLHLSDLSGFISVDAVGQITNFRPPVTRASAGLGRLPDVAHASYALVLGMVILIVLALAVLLRRRRSLQAWALLAAAGVGLVFVAINPYGNEAIFRATLFGIPWLVLLGARVFGHRSWRLSALPLAVVATALTATFLVSSFALDPLNVVRQSDVRAFNLFTAQNSGQRSSHEYLLLLGAGDLPVAAPTRGTNHALVTQKSIGDPVQQLSADPGAADVARLTRELVRYSGNGKAGPVNLYAFWSPVSASWDQAYGLQTYAQFVALRTAFASSAYWTVLSNQDGTFLFRLDGQKYAALVGGSAATGAPAAVAAHPATTARTTAAATTTAPATSRPAASAAATSAPSPAATATPLLTPVATVSP